MHVVQFPQRACPIAATVYSTRCGSSVKQSCLLLSNLFKDVQRAFALGGLKSS